MVLADKEIRSLAQNESAPLITPFQEAQLQGASYDVSLSGRISTFQKNVQTIDLETISQEELDGLYQEYSMGPDGYILQPGEYILAQLKETLTLPGDITAHLRPRTRFTRLGLLLSPQHCNATYSGQLYVGLYNASPNALTLREGTVVAQVVFEQLSQTVSENKRYENKPNAAYMNEREFRGSILREKGWSKALEDTYQDLLARLDERG